MKTAWTGVTTNKTGHFLEVFTFSSYDAALALATKQGYTISSYSKFKKIHENGSIFWIEECLVRE